jgi:hypothetical protein
VSAGLRSDGVGRDVALLDPALDHGPIRLARNGFLIAWEEFDCLAAVISN